MKLDRRRVLVAMTWLVSAVLGVGLVFSGLNRLELTPEAVRQFEAFGYGLAFLCLVGGLEVAGGVGLVIPKVARWAGVGLMVMMLAAIWSHVVSGYGSPLHAARTLVLLVAVAVARALTGAPDASPEQREAAA